MSSNGEKDVISFADSFCRRHGGKAKIDAKDTSNKGSSSSSVKLNSKPTISMKPLPAYCGRVIKSSLGRKCKDVTKTQKECGLNVYKGRFLSSFKILRKIEAVRRNPNGFFY